MPDATPPLTAPGVVAGLLADVAEARAQLAEARTAFANLAGHFTQAKQSGWTARVSGTVLRRLCAMAMCEPPSGSDAPDEASEWAVKAAQACQERDEAREKLDEIRAMVDAAPKPASAEQLGIVLRAIHAEAGPDAP